MTCNSTAVYANLKLFHQPKKKSQMISSDLFGYTGCYLHFQILVCVNAPFLLHYQASSSLLSLSGISSDTFCRVKFI